ncbi:MAG: FAD-dependent monooxygenase [Sporocytophaga sp.]|uniref:FAD-dependent oxidoreductase n=1 Tax=Sporocytophaga sp. TaxID=2231183 RepID=UPI001B15A78B|nr:NAD(P)/FAD-dependent oxidoreductase [Sporocytophaga sp.]MBO9699041.1 FAD-dependent monooxygenase [Sporocytophaga sp.]
MEKIRNKRIAIIGGGPGGLTLARLLQMNGADVKVYERDLNKDARVQGATLDLHEESGLRAIREAGLMDAFKANYRPGADKIRITDKHAAILYDQHDEQGQDEAFGDEYFRPEIDRGPLRKVLLASLKSDTVVWNSHFKTMAEVEGSWKLEFQNGTTALADIVVAADGANSKIRPFITPLKPFYSGVTIVEGAVYNAETEAPEIYKLVKGGKVFAFGDEKSLIVSSKGDGSITFYTGCKTNESWYKDSKIDFNNIDQVKDWFIKEFIGWDSKWLELFEKAEPHFIPRPQYCMPLDQSWTPLTNLTMLGDAAHLMPPYAGEGVNMAMLDAVELCNCLLNPQLPNIHSAIAAYESQMLVRFKDVAQMTLDQADSLHSPNAVSNMLELFNQM